MFLELIKLAMRSPFWEGYQRVRMLLPEMMRSRELQQAVRRVRKLYTGEVIPKQFHGIQVAADMDVIEQALLKGNPSKAIQLARYFEYQESHIPEAVKEMATRAVRRTGVTYGDVVRRSVRGIERQNAGWWEGLNKLDVTHMTPDEAARVLSERLTGKVKRTQSFWDDLNETWSKQRAEEQARRARGSAWDDAARAARQEAWKRARDWDARGHDWRKSAEEWWHNATKEDWKSGDVKRAYGEWLKKYRSDFGNFEDEASSKAYHDYWQQQAEYWKNEYYSRKAAASRRRASAARRTTYTYSTSSGSGQSNRKRSSSGSSGRTSGDSYEPSYGGGGGSSSRSSGGDSTLLWLLLGLTGAAGLGAIIMNSSNKKKPETDEERRRRQRTAA